MNDEAQDATANTNESAASDPSNSRAPASRLRRGFYVVAAIVAIWLLGDGIYAAVIHYRYQAWEAGIKRDEDGVREGCREFSIGEGDTALLLVHGINDSPACYREMAGELAKRGYHCRVMRLPGFAETLDRYAAANREQWLAAVRAELATLRESHRRVFIVAHSLGGAITIRLLRESPDAADGVVLLAPAANVASNRSPVFSPETWHSVANRLLVFTNATESPFGLDAKVADDDSYPYRSPFTPRSMFDETFALIAENRGRAAELRTPMLMVLSPDDVVIDVPAARKYFEESSAQPKILVEVEETGHSMTVDHQWPVVVDHIDTFTKQLAADAPREDADERP